jgi:hypothetical protein
MAFLVSGGYRRSAYRGARSMSALQRQVGFLQGAKAKFGQFRLPWFSRSGLCSWSAGAFAALGVFPCLPAAAECAAKDRESGFVFQQEGAWVRGTGTPLAMFDPVCAGDEIRSLSRPDQSRSLTIALYDGTADPLVCKPQEECPRYKVKDIQVHKEDGFLQRLRNALARLDPREVDIVAVPGVRGVGPREAVVAEASGSVDLAPALANVRPGRYSVELRPWTKTGLGSRATALEVTWRRPTASVVSGAAPAPGLYQMSMADRAGMGLGGALVLIVQDADFAAAHSAFDRIRAIGEKWEDTAGEKAARRLQVEALLAMGRDSSIIKGAP